MPEQHLDDIGRVGHGDAQGAPQCMARLMKHLEAVRELPQHGTCQSSTLTTSAGLATVMPRALVSSAAAARPPKLMSPWLFENRLRVCSYLRCSRASAAHTPCYALM